MNDQQLLEMLRAIDRPVEPEPQFADRLYAHIEGRARRWRPSSRTLLLAAALLAAAAVGAAVIVGSQLLDQQPLVVESADPNATGEPYTVHIPSNVSPESTPQEVAGRAAALGRVLGITLIVEGTQLPVDGGLTDPLNEAIWQVVLQRPDGRFVTYLFRDDDLGIFSPQPALPAYPEPTLVPLPTWDPLLQLALESDVGRTVKMSTIALPGIAPDQRIGPLVVVGDAAWAKVTDADSGAVVRLLRLDARAASTVLVDVPTHLMGYELHAGIGRLWLESLVETELYQLDRETGLLVDSIASPYASNFLGEDADGLWFRVYPDGNLTTKAGAVLIDPDTGKELRRIDTPDQGGAYRGFWSVPAFGSLWDTSEDGILYRVDAVSGEVQAAIDLTLGAPVDAGGCGGLTRPFDRGVGVDDVLTVFCGGRRIGIDLDTNAITSVVPTDGRPSVAFDVIAGQPWSRRLADIGTSSFVGTLARVDPDDGRALETLTLSRERTVVLEAPVVMGGHVWLLVGELSRPDDPFAQNQALIRIPVGELAG